MAPHSSILAWKIPWMKEPGGLQSMGSLRGRHDWATSLSLFTFMHWIRKWQPIPMFLPGEFQGQGSLVGCRLWGCTELDTTEVTQQQQQQLLPPAPPPFFWEKLLMPLTVPCKFRQACPLSPTLHTPNTHLRLAWFQNSSTLPELAPPLASMCSWHPSGWRRPRSEAGGGDGES